MFNNISLPYRILAVAALALLLFGSGLRLGWVLSANSKDAAELKVQVKTEKKRQQREEAATVAALANAISGEKTRVVYQTITKEVIKYAQAHPAPIASESAIACNTLDAGWVRIHDLAADPDVESASVSAGKAGEAGKADALGVVTRNYEACQIWREQLLGWQAWWVTQRVLN